LTTFLTIEPRDPIIARDGRPFGINSGRRMKPLEWPYPSVVAGSLRTAIGKATGGHFDDELISSLKSLQLAGPFPRDVDAETLFLPAAGDLVRMQGGSCHPLRPVRVGKFGGTDLPGDLAPVCPPANVTGNKPERVPAWWSVANMAAWLASPGAPPADFLRPACGFRDAPEIDERTHLEIDPQTYGAMDGRLFSSAGLVLDELSLGGVRHQTDLTIRVRNAPTPLGAFDMVHPLGGERRVARFRAPDQAVCKRLWSCPAPVRQALARVTPGDSTIGVRMVLATPAIFEGGWRPEWLDADELAGSPPGCTGLALKLVGVCNQRWRAVSGWSYEAATFGPKRIWRLVPAGGVYFFELVNGNPADLADRWLEPVGDERVDEGFGLAVWGIWSWGDN